MDGAVADLLAALAMSHDVNAQCRELDRWSARGAVGSLRKAGMLLAKRVAETGSDSWQYRSALDRIERHLALVPGAARAQSAVDLAFTHAALGSRQRVVRLAALLAGGQPSEVLVALVAGATVDGGSADVWACLIQEMVVRGTDLDRNPTLQTLIDRLRQVNHPLSTLPVRLLPDEVDLPVPLFSPTGHSVAPIQGLGTVATHRADTRTRSVPTATQVTTAEQRRHLTAVVRTWLDESNGRAEAEVSVFADRLSTDDVDALAVSSLSLDCLSGARAEDTAPRAATSASDRLISAGALSPIRPTTPARRHP